MQLYGRAVRLAGSAPDAQNDFSEHVTARQVFMGLRRPLQRVGCDNWNLQPRLLDGSAPPLELADACSGIVRFDREAVPLARRGFHAVRVRNAAAAANAV